MPGDDKPPPQIADQLPEHGADKKSLSWNTYSDLFRVINRTDSLRNL